MLGKVAITSVFSVTIQIFGLVSGVLVARMLGVDGRGELAVIMMWPSIIVTSGLLGVDIILARKSHHYDIFDASLYRTAIFFSVMLGATFILIGSFMLPYILSENKLYLQSLVEIFLLSVPFSMLLILLYSIALGQGDIKRYNYFRLIFSPVYIISLLIIIMSFEATVGNVVYGFVASAAFTGFVVLAYAMKGCKIISPPMDKISILREGAPFGISTAMYSFSIHLPTILLAALVDVKMIGLFAVAYVVSTIHIPFGNAVGKVLFSEAATTSNDVKQDGIVSRFKLILLAYSFIAFASLLILPIILSLLYGSEFSDATPMLHYLIPYTCILAVTGISDEVLKGYGISRPGIIARLIGVLVLIIIGFVFIIAMGIQGLLYTLLIKSIIEFCVISVGLARFIEVRPLVLFKYKMDDYFYLKKILLAGVS